MTGVRVKEDAIGRVQANTGQTRHHMLPNLHSGLIEGQSAAPSPGPSPVHPFCETVRDDKIARLGFAASA
jgi:hypothetical protein